VLRQGIVIAVVALPASHAGWFVAERLLGNGDVGALFNAAGPIVLLYGLWLAWQGRRPMRLRVDEAGVTFGEGRRAPTTWRWEQLSGVTIEKLPRSGADQLFLRLWPVAAQASPNRLPQSGSRNLIHVRALVEPVEELAGALHRYGGARYGRH
jgi:hypothetical protein